MSTENIFLDQKELSNQKNLIKEELRKIALNYPKEKEIERYVDRYESPELSNIEKMKKFLLVDFLPIELKNVFGTNKVEETTLLLEETTFFMEDNEFIANENELEQENLVKSDYEEEKISEEEESIENESDEDEENEGNNEEYF